MRRRVLTAAVLSLVVLTTSGCTSLWRGTARSYRVAPSGLPWGEDFVRRALVMGSFEQALARTAPKADGAPSDPLLQALFRGQVAYYAGQWEESGRAFAEADRLTEQRYTKSASRGVLSLLTNDHALAYAPPRTERLFSRYYAMLGRLQSGDVSGAAVDARRLSALLEESAVELDAAERSTHAMLRDVAGAVFEAAGEWNDAGVAYRNAALLRGVPRAAVDSITVTRPLGDSATVVLVLESGFVAHYVARTLAIPMDEGTASRLAPRLPDGAMERFIADQARRRIADRSESNRGASSGSPDRAPAGVRPPHDADGTTDLVGTIAPLPLVGPTSAPPVVPGVAFADSTPAARATAARRRSMPSVQWMAALDALPDGGVFDEIVSESTEPLAPSSAEASAHAVSADWTPRQRRSTRYLGDRSAFRNWMEISWPALVRPRLPSAAVQVALRGVIADTMPWSRTDAMPVTPAGLADISDAVGADARRMRGARLARLTARTLSRMAVVEALDEKHGPAAGMLAGLVVSAIERADTRAWHLLPGRVSVVRLTVPAGELTPSLLQGQGANALPHALPAHRLAAGSVAVLTTRLWRDPAGGAEVGGPRVAASEGGATVIHR
jgi:hypothetical protein